MLARSTASFACSCFVTVVLLISSCVELVLPTQTLKRQALFYTWLWDLLGEKDLCFDLNISFLLFCFKLWGMPHFQMKIFIMFKNIINSEAVYTSLNLKGLDFSINHGIQQVSQLLQNRKQNQPCIDYYDFTISTHKGYLYL